MFIVTYLGIAGATKVLWYLKATTWTSELDRADKFASQEAAYAALARASKFMKASVRRAAVVHEIPEVQS